MTTRVRTEVQGQLARVTLTRGEVHNGVDFDMIDALLDAARTLRDERKVRAVILSGEGPSFCAGLDVKSVLGNPRLAALAMTKLYAPMRNKFQDCSMVWRTLPMPVIAAIHGNCFGAGIQIAMGADIRIAHPDAKLSVMESKWGLVPDMGGSVLLRELVGADQAKLLTFTGRVLDGRQALEVGLVTQVDENPLAAAEALATEIATRSPDAVAAAKFLLQETRVDADEDEALAAERRAQRRIIGRGNQRIAVARNTGDPEKAYTPRRINR